VGGQLNVPTFGDKHALVSAEIARLDVTDLEAMRLYEDAITLAHTHGFVQNEGIAYESPRGSTQHAASRRSRTPIGGMPGTVIAAGAPRAKSGSSSSCTRSSVRLPPKRRPPPRCSAALARSWTSGAVVKASHAISGEIVLGQLIETLMTIALENAGAERGLLILLNGDVPQIEAEATTGHGTVHVTVRQSAATSAISRSPRCNTSFARGSGWFLDDAAGAAPGTVAEARA